MQSYSRRWRSSRYSTTARIGPAPRNQALDINGVLNHIITSNKYVNSADSGTKEPASSHTYLFRNPYDNMFTTRMFGHEFNGVRFDYILKTLTTVLCPCLSLNVFLAGAQRVRTDLLHICPAYPSCLAGPYAHETVSRT